MAERKPEFGDNVIATGYGPYARPDECHKHSLFYVSSKVLGAFRGEK